LEELRLEDWRAFYAGVYLLQAQAQALIDIAQRGCSELGLRVGGYVDAGRGFKKVYLLALKIVNELKKRGIDP
jgi:uncharacterized protein YutE (UPF0331/DUF86 family)